MAVVLLNKAGAGVLVKKKDKAEEKLVEEDQEDQKEVNQTINVLSVKMITLLRNVPRGEMRKIAKLSSTT